MSATPGPWRVETQGGCPPHRWSIWAENGRCIATFPQLVEPARAQQEEDARLIAAAPDLLAALQSILPMAESAHFGGPDTHALLVSARAAIAKATTHD